MSTHDTIPDMEQRLRAALAARADLVQPEDLAPLTPVVALRPRWQSPWVLLATAAVVLLVLGVVFQGLGRDPRSDDVAPRPDERVELELPPDIGRDWEAEDGASPARLDLDGDGRRERVRFLSEPSEEFDGRTRLETTLTSTGEEVYGIAQLASTISTYALDPVDSDQDGDQELVLLFEDLGAEGPGGLSHPMVFDLRDGLLVQAPVEDPDLLVRGYEPVDGTATDHYDLVRLHEFWLEDGRLGSSRTVGSYARGNMTLFAPQAAVVDAWEWHLDEDGVLRHGESSCLFQEGDRRRPCGDDPADSIPVQPGAAAYAAVGESVGFTRSYPFTARLEAGSPVTLVADAGGRTLRHEVEVPDPRLGTVQPESVFYDGVSVVVASASDPTLLEVLVQRDDRLVALQPVGEIPFVNDASVRTWLNENGSVMSAVADDGDRWVLWQWMMVSGTEMAALPWGEVCFDDVEDPSTARQC